MVEELNQEMADYTAELNQRVIRHAAHINDLMSAVYSNSALCITLTAKKDTTDNFIRAFFSHLMGLEGSLHIFVLNKNGEGLRNIN